MRLFWPTGIPRHGVLLLTVAVGIALTALFAYDLRAAGVRDVIYKPNAADELARAVGRLLAGVAAR